jgi:hypothetical protein
MTNLGGGVWSYNSWIPTSTGNYSYKIYIQDTAKNWNMTYSAIQVVDTTPPTYTSVTESADPLKLGGTETITITGVADFSGIQTVWIAFEGANHTMTNLGGGVWRYNNWIPSNLTTYAYTIYIQDNIGIWNGVNGSIQVEQPIPAFRLPFIILSAVITIGFLIWKKRTNL